METWMDRATAGRGVVACGVRRADRSFIVKSGRAEFAFDRPYYPSGAQDPAHPEIQRLAAAYQKVTGQPLVLGFGRGVCDGDYLAEAGIPTVSFGPSGGSTHQANEWVSIEQLGAAAEVYLRICLEG